ncbi:MAG: dihydroxyacetone kinase phosphoryl donor subunit DhaM [Bowdeniella nasicola]|nr:dihydroxyacetone kinase phosphoryl donor subunit DhaM [Bowdeniella nasicola]
MSVRLVIVSHSQRLADGVVELAAQMAPDVILRAVGGTDDGGIGTSFTKVLDAVEEGVDAGDDVALLTDLGSATMTAESVLDFVPEGRHVALAEGPLVEGAVAGAVCAAGGGSLTQVLSAVAEAATSLTPADSDTERSAREASASNPRASGAHDDVGERRHASGESDDANAPAASRGEGPTLREDFILRNSVGLHARPAATLSRLASQFEAAIEVNGKPATSVLSLMSLGLGQGATMHVTAAGDQAGEALHAIRELVDANFGETHAE